MVQKLSIDPDIIDNSILENSLIKIDQGFQNLMEVKKMESPSIFLNKEIKEQIIKNIIQLKIYLNNNIEQNEEFRKLANNSHRIESLMSQLLNSPEYIYKFKDQNFDNLKFKDYIKKLYEKFGSSFLDFILVGKILRSGFLEIDQYLSKYLEERRNFNREYYFSKDISNFEDFSNKIIDKLGFDEFGKNQKIYLINPGILRTINNYNLNKNNESYLRNFLDLCVTIKCICFHFLEKFKNSDNFPSVIIATDNPGNKLDETLLRDIFFKEFIEIRENINLQLVVINHWGKKSRREQGYIFSSNEFGFVSNVDLNFLRKSIHGNNQDAYKSIKNTYSQFKVARHGILTEISQSSYKNFVYDELIQKIENKLNTIIYTSNNGNIPKNQPFLEALKNFNK